LQKLGQLQEKKLKKRQLKGDISIFKKR